LTSKRFIAAVVVLGVLAYLWAAYRALSGTTHAGEARTVVDVPHLGTALDWLRPRGPLVYIVVEGIRGPEAFVSGEAAGDIEAAAEAAGFRTLSGDEGVSKELSAGIRNLGGEPARFTVDFGEDGKWYMCGPSPGWDTVQVYYRKSDRRFTARLIRSTDRGR
jgi:hypothetical protein